MQRNIFFAIILLLLGVLSASAENAYLLEKAAEFEENLQAHHLPGYGGVVEVVYESVESMDSVLFYRALGDSTMWTSTYMAAESFRYAVTKDPEAQANAIAALETLHDHMAVTQTPGYIGRYVGPSDPKYLFDYYQSPLLRQGEDEWEGTFWLGNSSSDQHVGWFFGMGAAYDLLDDEDARELIRQDVRLVIDRLREHHWLIIDERGLPTTAAPNISGSERMAFLLTAAHILEDAELWELYQEEYTKGLPTFKLKSIAYFNLYTEYFAFNLRHQNYHQIFSYETDPARLAFYWEVFNGMGRDLVAWTHNVFFDYVYLNACKTVDACEQEEEIVADGIKSLTDFPESPVRDVHVDCPLLPIDPMSRLFVDIQDWIGIDLGFELRTLEPHEIANRCREGFLWQREPTHVICYGFFDQLVFPGVDYLLAYWMGRYYNYIDPAPADDDDDSTNDDDGADDDDDDDDDPGSGPEQPSEDDDDLQESDPAGDDDEDEGCCG